MIRIHNLTFSYGHVPAQGEAEAAGTTFQLNIPHLEIAAAEKVALVGRSGCGKTTLLNLIAGIAAVQSGELMVAGTRLDQLDETARRRFRSEHMGFAFQEFELIEYLNVRDNILLPFTLNGSTLDCREREQRLQDLLNATELTARSKYFPRQLSQGQRQRVALCRAMITEPQLILADEPTGNLDAQTAADVLNLLMDQVQTLSATLVMVTHDPNVLNRFDRVIHLDEVSAG